MTLTALEKTSGRSRAQWFAALDKWGAPGRPFGEISDWLRGTHGLSKWWAQKLIVEYEQDRGLREPGVRQNGTFEVTASKTVDVPAARLFEAFTDSRARKKWLPDAQMRLVASRGKQSARFSFNGGTQVYVTFEPKGRSKAAVAVVHQRLSNGRDAQAKKSMWRASLSELKSFLEA